MLPIPYAREVFSYIGHRISGGTYENYKTMCRDEGSFNNSTSEEVTCPKHAVAAVYGINTASYESHSMSEGIKQRHGNTKVHYTHNRTHGVFLDVLECIALKLGFKTHCVDKLVENLRARINEVGGVGSDGTVSVYAHSQGGLILKRALSYLSPEEKQMLHITTLGSAAMISNEGVGSAINCVNSGDIVPIIADPLGILAGFFSKKYDIRFRSSGFLEHGFESPNYQREIKRCGYLYQKSLGVS